MYGVRYVRYWYVAVTQAPFEDAYPERQQVSRIRERLPKLGQTYLLEWEVKNATIINSYAILMPCLDIQDIWSSYSQESKNQPSPSTKRPAIEAALQAAEVVGSRLKNRKVDNRPFCSFCSKLGHNAKACWVKYPDKKVHSIKRKSARTTSLPLNNITVASLQAMVSKAVDNVLSSTNKSTS